MNCAVQRRRLEMQGYPDLDDRTLAEIGPWLRLAPALCAGLVAAATLLGSAPLVVAIAGTAILGAILPHHPFEYLYQSGLRRITGGRPLPPNGAPRRFACAFATVWLIATAGAFATGSVVAGRILGGMFVAVAMIPVLTDFCVPSFIFQIVARRRVAARQPGVQP